MAGKRKKRPQLDFRDLQELVARNKKDLEETRTELKKLGDELKKEHMRRMLHPEGVSLTRGRQVPTFNRMCRKCLNSCKQSESAKIFNCSKYEPVE